MTYAFRQWNKRRDGNLWEGQASMGSNIDEAGWRVGKGNKANIESQYTAWYLLLGLGEEWGWRDCFVGLLFSDSILETRSYCVSQADIDPPASAFSVLGLESCTITPCYNMIIFVLVFIALFVCCCYCSKTVFRYVPRLAWNLPCRPSLTWTHRHLPAAASQGLTLKCTTTSHQYLV